MPDLAETQVQRLVSLIAWMSQGDRETPVSIRAAARRLGVTEQTLRKDLDALIGLTDEMKPWLGSLQLAFTADGFILGSLGAFRRPLRLTGDESLALILGLLQGRGGKDLAVKLGRLLDQAPASQETERVWAVGPTPGEGVAQVLGLARRARDESRRLELTYCGSAEEPSMRVVHPYQIVEHGGHWYVIAWCEQARAKRHFRAERILSARLLPESFDRKPEMTNVRGDRDLFSGAATLTAVVAFSTTIKRWIRERYPGGEEAPDGRYVVRFPVADPRWLAREVLQYGAEAEVLEPEGVREVVRAMVGAQP
jgi:predicted DNA-binding transcriptional regulator YafY